MQSFLGNSLINTVGRCVVLVILEWVVEWEEAKPLVLQFQHYIIWVCINTLTEYSNVYQWKSMHRLFRNGNVRFYIHENLLVRLDGYPEISDLRYVRRQVCCHLFSKQRKTLKVSLSAGKYMVDMF